MRKRSRWVIAAAVPALIALAVGWGHPAAAADRESLIKEFPSDVQKLFTPDIPTSKASLQASCRGLKTPSGKLSNDEVIAETLLLYHLLNIIFKCIKIDFISGRLHN